jgi:hypothetical protein
MSMIYRPISSSPEDSRLGRYIPDNFDHVVKYPFAAVAARSVMSVEKVLKLPSWHWQHDQGAEGSCVGHGVAMERAITNTTQNVILNALGMKTRWYDSIDIWNRAKEIDPWPDTNPGDDNGTSVHAGYDVCRVQGIRRVSSMKLVNEVPQPQGEMARDFKEGVATNRWATTVDQMRSGISLGLPIAIGVNWYSNFDTPIMIGGENWIGRSPILGSIRGGHCVCLYGASDKRQAFRVKNSWGRSYPLVWLPYATMQRLLDEDGEAALVTDR